MVTITVVRNPFNLGDRDILTVEHIPGKTLYQYIQPHIMGLDDFICSVNGHKLERETVLVDGDYLAVCPVVGKSGGNLFRMIASIALMAYTGNIANGLWTHGEVGLVSALASTAVGFIGGQIINSVFPAATPDMPDYQATTTSASYGWGQLSANASQGGALARTYGTVRTAGTELAKHITSDGDKQYLNLLLTGGQGPVDSITDIRINDNPISNFSGVVVETRLGTNDQPLIENFNDTFADQSLAYELTVPGGYATQLTEGNGGQGLEITLTLPGGLYHMNDAGNLVNATVQVQSQYRLAGGQWVDWATWEITAAKNTALTRSFRRDNLTIGQYEVRCKCIYKSGETTRDGTRVYWTQLSHIIYDDFRRPNKVLVGIKALATDQLNGSDITVTWKQSVEHVHVWNPSAKEYQLKPARNPAWASYDIVHSCRKLKNIATGEYKYVVDNVPANQLEYPFFADWADRCTELGLEFEHMFEAATDMWSTLRIPETFGRGKVIMKGTRFSAICDKPSTPVQLFTVGNMNQNTFSKEYLGLTDRANAVEISFVNRAKGYQKDAITVYGDDWNTSEVIKNPTQITLYGCTSYEQAYKHGLYLLKVNKLLLRTIHFEADIDAIACQIGDQILVQHDVPEWGEGGRLLAATLTTITLDRTVTIYEGKAYSIMVRLQDDTLVTRAVTNPAGEHLQLTVSSPFDTVPNQWDVYSFGEVTKVAKPFIVLDVNRADELTGAISAVEYVPALYDDTGTVPVIDYTAGNDQIFEVSSLLISEENYRTKDGTNTCNLSVGWEVPRGKRHDGFLVDYRRNSGSWITAGHVYNNTAVIPGVPGAVNEVRVRVVKGIIISLGVSVSYIATGKDAPPSNVPSLAATIEPSDSTKINLNWSAVTDIDLNGYQVMEGTTILTPTPISDTRYVYTATASRQHKFSVVAVDNSGNISQIPAATTINVTIEPALVAGFTAVIQDTDRSRLVFSWSANIEKDISYYELRTGDDWDSGTIIATQLKAIAYTHVLNMEGSQNFMIKAVNVAGYASLQAAVKQLQIILRPDAVTNLQAAQEPRDRSMVKVAWTASAGKDIAGYELRYGNNWSSGSPITTVKESTYGWYIPNTGTYNIMVQARTVAGYVSNIANVSITAMIEAYDVTGFTAIQSLSDRTKLTLLWDSPLSLDVAYFIIKKGASWDAGSIVTLRTTGTFYDVIIHDEGEQVFWIKAVTVAGKESLNPAHLSGVFNLNPEPVSNIILEQDPNDRSIVNIAFSAVPESDLANYEIRAGYVWQEAEVVGTTKELHFTYSPPNTGDVKIMVKAVNNAGFYSDEASANLYVTLEPGNVNGFRVFQNGEKLAFVWHPVPDNDVVGYELREGASYETSMLVANGISATQYQLGIDTEITRRFHLKSVNRSGHYSTSAASVNVTITDLPPKNVIRNYDEIMLKSGSHNGTEFGKSLITFATLPGTFPDYPVTKFSDIGGTMVLKLMQSNGVYPAVGTYNCVRKDLGQVITANITTVFQPSILYTAGTSASLEYRLSRNGDVWSDWQPFSPVEATFRYMEFRVFLTTQDVTKTPEINQLNIRVDVPDKDIAKSVVVPVGGVTVSYGHTYYETPVVTPTAEGVISRAVWSNKTKSSVDLQVVNNSTGADIGGNIDLRVKGY